jgi:hypothetical protein
MSLILFAAALFAQPAPDDPATAGRLYDGCVRYVATASAPAANSGDLGVAICAMTLATFAAQNAAEDATEGGDRGGLPPRAICVPDAVWQVDSDTGLPFAQAFIAYVDAHPAVRGQNGEEVFRRALAEKWPCPH